jgi:hypothetical protein
LLNDAVTEPFDLHGIENVARSAEYSSRIVPHFEISPGHIEAVGVASAERDLGTFAEQLFNCRQPDA